MIDENLAKFVEAFADRLSDWTIRKDQEARKLYNGMIDKRPRLIARCADVADVIAAVNFGRDKSLPIAIRGGGHNGPGFGTVDEGLVIDLSKMKKHPR